MYKLQVTADKLNIRNSPDADPQYANWIGDMLKGEEFDAIDIVKGNGYNGISYWYRDNYNRYVSITGAQANNPAIQWSLAILGIPHIWNKTKGKGIKIAIIDSGIDLKKTDLSTAVSIANRYNIFDGTSNVQDSNYHGTYCSTLAASRGSKGVLGVAPESELIIIKMANSLDDYGDNNVINGIKKALEMEADIISMSFGNTKDNPQIQALLNKAMQSGIICIAATGNFPEDHVRYPANYKGVISVGNVSCSNHTAALGEGIFAISKDSNNGIADNNNEGVTIVAPGDGVSAYNPLSNNVWGPISGSSYATPFVAGVAALWLSLIKNKQQPVNYHQSFRTFIITNATKNYNGYDPRSWGFGVINPIALLSV